MHGLTRCAQKHLFLTCCSKAREIKDAFILAFKAKMPGWNLQHAAKPSNVEVLAHFENFL